jgi:hypothetical protein
MTKRLSPVSEKSKAKILEHFSRGLNATQIMAKIPGHSRQQIAAIMAWKTMEKNPPRKSQKQEKGYTIHIKLPRSLVVTID